MQKPLKRLSRKEVSELIAAFKLNPARYLAKIRDPVIAKLLELHYINNVQWHDVADALNYTEQNIYKLRRKALNQLSQISKEDSTNGTKIY